VAGSNVRPRSYVWGVLSQVTYVIQSCLVDARGMSHTENWIQEKK